MKFTPFSRIAKTVFLLWKYLTEPVSSLQGAESRESAQHLSAMLLVNAAGLVILYGMYTSLACLQNPADPKRLALVGGLAANLIAYVISRFGYTRIACCFLVASNVLGISIDVMKAPDARLLLAPLPGLVSNTVICSLVLSQIETLAVFVFSGSAYIFLFSSIPIDIRGPFLISGICYLITSALALVGTHSRRTAEASMRKSERLYKATFENAAVGIAHVATDGKVLLANSGCQEILGYTELEFKDLYLFRMSHPEDYEQGKTMMKRMLQGELSTYRTEKRYLHKDGRFVWTQICPRLIRDERGVAHYFVIIIQDISDRKASEAIIEQQRAEMTVVAKMSALGEMSSGIAHEINNPLAIIHGRAHLLKKLSKLDQVTPEGVSKVADTIESMALRISKIVRSLKNFSRNGSDEPFQSVSLDSIFMDVFELSSARFKSHGILLKFATLTAELKIECQAVQVAQVLLNLLNNAHDAVEELNEKWVNVSIRETATHIEILVTDSGNGIKAELREKILTPFFTTKPAGKGTGLGLSISRTIAESHKGKLELDENCPNTCFIVTLPKTQKNAVDYVA
jgi:PAS domain S-box-containing protein